MTEDTGIVRGKQIIKIRAAIEETVNGEIPCFQARLIGATFWSQGVTREEALRNLLDTLKAAGMSDQQTDYNVI